MRRSSSKTCGSAACRRQYCQQPACSTSREATNRSGREVPYSRSYSRRERAEVVVNCWIKGRLLELSFDQCKMNLKGRDPWAELLTPIDRSASAKLSRYSALVPDGPTDLAIC